MPISNLGSVQHVLQMSTAAERVVVEGHANHATDHIRNLERAALDEKKRSEVQEPDGTQESASTDPDEKGSHGQVRLKKKRSPSEKEEETLEPESLPFAEGNPSSHLDIRV